MVNPSNTRFALAAAAGALNGVAFIWYGPIALVANVPLLVALRDARSATQAAALGALVGFLGGVHIYGVLNYGWLLFWGFALYTASQMVIYTLTIRALWGRAGPLFDLALPAIIWALTEWVRTVGPLAMPASYAGCVADVPAFAPWLALAPYTGGLGVSTAIALSQSVVYHGVFHRHTHGRATLVAAGLLAALTVHGLINPPPLGERTVRLAAVQGGLHNAQYKAAQADPSAMRDVVRTYATLSARAYATDAALVVWPETAVRAPVLSRPSLARQLLPGPQHHATLLAGLIRADGYGNKQNIAAVIAPGGHVIDTYAKVRLVPGAESHFTPGERFTPVKTPLGPVGVLLCLESVYPSAGRALTAAGAELLVVMSNDAGFGYTPIARHMTNRAIIRAVESGRWLLRVGQAGISTLIDPRGATHGQLDLFQPGVLVADARLRTERTVFVRWGDWWAAFMLVLLVLGALRARRDTSAD